MCGELPMIERVLALLPPDGQPVVFGLVMHEAHKTLRLSAGSAGGYLSELCTAKRAAVETRQGYTFARRLPLLPDFAPRARPHLPPPPLRRHAPRPQAPKPARKGRKGR